jgi:hypothetical protein
MNMLDMIGSAQGGRAVDNLAQQFGLSDQQAAAAIQALLPALSSGLKRNTATPEGLAGLLGALNQGGHERYYDDQNMFAESGVRDDGNRILGHVLGSKQISRAAVERASEQTGVGASILKQMLPYIAALVMSALSKEGRNPLNDILGQILGGGSQSGDNPFGPLADVIMGGGQQKSTPQGSSPSTSSPSAIDIFGSMLDADGDGSAMDDIFEMITKASR